MNINNIKKEFPIFDEKIQNNDLVYLDSANSSQKPKVVLDRINDFYSKQFSNVGRSIHYLAVAATNLYENTRSSVQKYINAKDKNEIVFTKGATEALNLVANTLGQAILEPNDEILITELEHHSNYVPWHFLRKKKGVIIKFAPINKNGEIEIEEFKKLISKKTKIIAITHLSNVTGAITPLKDIIELAKEKKIPVLVDGTQGAPHLKLDMQELDCDFYAISCHKMYGPNGLGILYAKKNWLEELPPYQGGGGMISDVQKAEISFAPNFTKFEAGTMQTAEVVAFSESIKFIETLGIENIENHENELLNYGIEKLKKNNSINILGNPKKRGSVISFTMKGVHPHDIATILDESGVAIRAGHHCCQILHDKLGIPASARASIGVYNDKEDIDIFCEAIENCKKVFNL